MGERGSTLGFPLSSIFLELCEVLLRKSNNQAFKLQKPEAESSIPSENIAIQIFSLRLIWLFFGYPGLLYR